MRQERGNAAHHEMSVAREKVHHRRPFASIGDVNHLGIGHEAEQLAAQMHDGAQARRSIAVHAWIGPQERDEFVQILRRHLGIDGKELARGADLRNRRELRVHVQLHPRVEKLIEHRRRNRVHDQRIAIRRGTCGDVGADGAAGTAAIVDENLLAELIGHMVRGNAGDHVCRPASRVRNDDADGARWIVRRQQRGRADGAEARPCEGGGGRSLQEGAPLHIGARHAGRAGSGNPNIHEWLHVTPTEDCLLISAALGARRA